MAIKDAKELFTALLFASGTIGLILSLILLVVLVVGPALKNEEPQVPVCDVAPYARALTVFWRSIYEADTGRIDHERFLAVNRAAASFELELGRVFEQSTTGQVPPHYYGTLLNAYYFRALSGSCPTEGVDA